MTRYVFPLLVASLALSQAIADDTTTSPRSIVNATIESLPNRDDMIFTGAYLHYETIESPFHAESQREQPHLANRTQRVTLLQSEIIRLGVNQLVFTSISGDKLAIADVKFRFEKNPLALLLPHGATMHPQLAVAFNADTVIITRVDNRSKPARLVPRPDGG